ncbi:MAG: membrane protein insertion efficiency factor YidD [Candidatus Kerfeldbacteria bacterium CG15_BIG_FIL_POST_REV_8_21_14_020_45_12]|uniref:Putative membrane protein insertion efficiency factor n=1 Tax=Candidatus Kerfeldbacteria bacterium CG15_BIG_FIL_POST_REV_8_21_14_020_45_12 TaxID=2014247 RepID=A0A2M7H314_9BACT|nr:MAG: membrane protein insertion efficiency factor YidD [Candidatus Kerfeldbacteria bacterium CG15_BIG_FIL_POST_REV_8_21_14_020_45_12]PJA93323.1 MAG: membrane protein insertion efficiency factor YidD [Candidatus Kerfeldbacteria bacterium CG_4_9_14_3_um_filter_45_8]
MSDQAVGVKITTIKSLPGRFLIGVIRLYQKTLSPDHRVYNRHPYVGCRYYPSCSEYTIRSIKKRGVIMGLLKGFWRILRCNPFTPGGVDESY